MASKLHRLLAPMHFAWLSTLNSLRRRSPAIGVRSNGLGTPQSPWRNSRRQERRLERRENLAIAISLPNGTLVFSRNISLSGMYLMLDQPAQLPDTLSLEIECAHLKLCAEARVLRVEKTKDGTGVAIRLLSQHLAPRSPD